MSRDESWREGKKTGKFVVVGVRSTEKVETGGELTVRMGGTPEGVSKSEIRILKESDSGQHDGRNGRWLPAGVMKPKGMLMKVWHVPQV